MWKEWVKKKKVGQGKKDQECLLSVTLMTPLGGS